MKYPIPQNPSKPTVIFNISGKMAIFLSVLLVIGIVLAFLVLPMFYVNSTQGIKIVFSLIPAGIYLILYYPLPDGRRLIDWISHIIRFFSTSQTYYYRRVRK